MTRRGSKKIQRARKILGSITTHDLDNLEQGQMILDAMRLLMQALEGKKEENKLICELTGEQCPLGSYDDCLDDDECEAICDKYKRKGLYIGENGQRIISDECTHERVLQYDN